MYYYFEGKDDLYASVLSWCSRRLAAAMPPPVAPTDVEAFWTTIRQSYRDAYAHLKTRPLDAAMSLHAAAAASLPSTLPGLMAIRDTMWAVIGRVLMVGRALGAVRSDLPEAYVHELVVSVVRASGARLLADGPEPGDEVLHQRLDEVVGVYRRLLAPA